MGGELFKMLLLHLLYQVTDFWCLDMNFSHQAQCQSMSLRLLTLAEVNLSMPGSWVIIIHLGMSPKISPELALSCSSWLIYLCLEVSGSYSIQCKRSRTWILWTIYIYIYLCFFFSFNCISSLVIWITNSTSSISGFSGQTT